MLGIAGTCPPAIGIGVIGVVIGRRATAGAGFASAVLGVAVFAPRTRRIGMRTVVRGTVSAGVAGHRPAVLTGGIVAPAPVTQAVRSIVIAGCTAISAIAFPAMLAAGIFFPRAVAITMAAGVNRFRFTLAADTRIRTITVAGAGCVALVVQHPCMAAAGRAGPGPIAAVAVLLVNVSAKIFYIMALITLVVLLMTSGCMRLLDVGALQRILLTAWAGADNAGGRTNSLLLCTGQPK